MPPRAVRRGYTAIGSECCRMYDSASTKHWQPRMVTPDTYPHQAKPAIRNGTYWRTGV